jgi:hypothetical protein
MLLKNQLFQANFAIQGNDHLHINLIQNLGEINKIPSFN